MNYQTSLLAILASYLVTLNAWAGCCFVGPPINLPPPTYPCIDTPNEAICADDLASAAYVNDNAFCIDTFTCCVQGRTAVIFFVDEAEAKLVPVSNYPECDPPVRLPVIIDEFTATLEDSGYVSLNGRVTNLGNRVSLDIWRAQIEEGDHGERVITGLTKMGDSIPIEGDPNMPVSFSETDTDPPNGVNYYVLTDYEDDGKLTIHCDDIRYVVVEEDTPNPEDLDLAKELCEGAALSHLIRVFKP